MIFFQRHWRDLNPGIVSVLSLPETLRKIRFGHMNHGLSQSWGEASPCPSLLLCLIPERYFKSSPGFLFFESSTLWQHLYISIKILKNINNPELLLYLLVLGHPALRDGGKDINRSETIKVASELRSLQKHQWDPLAYRRVTREKENWKTATVRHQCSRQASHSLPMKVRRGRKTPSY